MRPIMNTSACPWWHRWLYWLEFGRRGEVLCLRCGREGLRPW